MNIDLRLVINENIFEDFLNQRRLEAEDNVSCLSAINCCPINALDLFYFRGFDFERKLINFRIQFCLF